MFTAADHNDRMITEYKGNPIGQSSRCITEQLDEFQHIMRIAGGFDSLPANQFVAGTVLTSTSPAYARFSEIGKIK